MFDFALLAQFKPQILQLCGVVGSFIYVGGFALVQSEKICGNGPIYTLSQLVAAFLVLLSLIEAFNLGAFLIQVGFLGFGVWGLCRRPEKSVTSPNPITRSVPAE